MANRILSSFLLAGILIARLPAAAPVVGTPLPDGMSITPSAAPGSTYSTLNPHLPGLPDYVAGQPVTTSVSPDGKTLLVLTSGFNLYWSPDGNLLPQASAEYVFVYDISKNAPVNTGVLPIATTFCGLVWNPNGKEFYASGGAEDKVHVFGVQNGAWAEAAQIALGHQAGLGLAMPPIVAGLAVNARGDRLFAANMENDSVTVVDIVARAVVSELDLRPGVIDTKQAGVPGGEFPFWLAIRGNDKLYVSSIRDREIAVIDVSGTPVVKNRIAISGQPNRLILNRAQTRLFAAVDNTDTVVMIDTATDQILQTISATAPLAADGSQQISLKGSNPNSLALSPDEKTLYVTNGGTNSIAVIQLAGNSGKVTGLIPTGWYPNSVSVSADGSTLYVVNGKSVPGPNPQACVQKTSLPVGVDPVCTAANQYIWSLTKGGMLTVPVPSAASLGDLTAQVSANNRFVPAAEHDANQQVMAALRQKVNHVIYIVKENRTYDQVLGDLEKGNGDPSLALFPEPTTPNQHQIARQYVTLDNFYDSGEVSGVGWNWSTAGRATDYVEKTVPVSYAGRFGPVFYDYEGTNRNLNVGIPGFVDRITADPVTPQDPNQLPGSADVSAPDSSEGDVGAGYLWDAATRYRLQVRNYGFYIDLTRYNLPPSIPLNIPIAVDPFAAGIVQSYPTKAALAGVTDTYFRGFDNNYPDLYRFKEWEREFNDFVTNGNLPHLSLVRLMHDHTGSFGTAKYGVNTIETQVADNDYAVGLLVEKIANSAYKDNTMIFVLEDDAQDGPDHVDAHRSTAYIAGPYVKQGQLITTRYTTVNMLRTIKDLLGIGSMGLYDGLAEPMADLFDLSQKDWTFTSKVPEVLRTTQLPLPARTIANSLPRTANVLAYSKPRHSAKYWAKKMKDQNFDREDDLDEVSYNRALWTGLKGRKVPYPEVRDGRDLRNNRQALLAQ